MPGRPIRSLVAEDRSGGVVRDRTGPNPDAHGVAHETIRELAIQGGTGRETKTAKRLVRQATEEQRLHDDKSLQRLRA
jgi:hypothetical protein